MSKVSPWPFVGIGALACLLFLYGASGSFLPWYAVGLLIIIWLFLFVKAIQHFSPTSQWPMAMAITGVVMWMVVSVGGSSLFGWDLPEPDPPEKSGPGHDQSQGPSKGKTQSQP